LSLCSTKHYAMETCGAANVELHVVLALALVGGEWSASRPGALASGKEPPGTHCTGSWVGPAAGLDDMER
jgi:hypothetical protein